MTGSTIMASQLSGWGMAMFTSTNHEAASMAHCLGCSAMARFFPHPEEISRNF